MGFGVASFIVCLISHVAFASGMNLSADVEPSQISLDETVSLRLTLKSQSSVSIGDVAFSAPDFSVEGESSQVAVEYHSGPGGSSVQQTHELIRILRPKKTGHLKISKIEVEADGKTLRTSDLSVEVLSAQAHPPQGIAPKARSQKQAETGVLVRAEVDKTQVYKGEQVVVSYYLYHQMKVFNLQVDKFPILSGFLREDLDLPIMGQRLASQEVLFNGASYHRSLLARYAAYPLQEGKLSIDSISLKYNYYNGQRDFYDDEDPFFSFFQHLSPKVGMQASDPVEISVLAPPEDGKPESFTGGVGKFSVNSSLSAPEVQVDRAVSYFIKVEGKGNLSSVQAPKLNLPQGVELYETKSQMQKSKSGSGQKLFEYLIIPRVSGDITLPEVRLGFFDPSQKKYDQISTSELILRVTGQYSQPDPRSQGNADSQVAQTASPPSAGLTGSFSVPSPSSSLPTTPGERSVRPIKGHIASPSSLLWEALLAMNLGVFFALGFFLIRNRIRRSRSSPKSAWDEFRKKYPEASSQEKIRQAYPELVAFILDFMKEGGVSEVYSLNRQEQAHFLSEEQRDRFLRLMEKVDRLRFGGEATEDFGQTAFREAVELGESIRNQFEKRGRR